MKPRDYIINQINHIETDHVPFTVAFEQEMHERLTTHFGKADWDKSLNAYMHNIAYVDTVRCNGKNGVDMFGSVWYTGGNVWKIVEHPIKESTLDGYSFPSKDTLVAPIFENEHASIHNCQNESERFKLINMGWGIFERAWMLRGFEDFLMDCLCEQDFVKELLEGITNCYLEMVRACQNIPADGILFGDDWGEQRGIIMGADVWRKFFKPCWKQVYDEVHRQGKYVLSHSCGSIHDILDDLIEIGLDVYESVQPEPSKMNPYDLKKKFGDKITFWGCLGTQSIIPQGTVAELNEEMEHLCREMGKGGGYIFAPTKPLQIDTPIENAVAVVDYLKQLMP